MGDTLERAAEDAGARALLARADSIRIPRGFWDYSDPARALAERFGCGSARTCVAEIGVLQTTLLGAAARDIAEGRADVVLVAGAEARHRAQRARQLGVGAAHRPCPRRPTSSPHARDHQPARGEGRVSAPPSTP
jgi:acetyl-CoA C-acetyltransferase